LCLLVFYVARRYSEETGAPASECRRRTWRTLGTKGSGTCPEAGAPTPTAIRHGTFIEAFGEAVWTLPSFRAERC
jgi:hypothetical protein